MIDLMAAVNTVIGVERALAPYDTGNLMNNGISNVESVVFNVATYRINAHDTAPYGIILNEAPVIGYKNGVYVNRHYMWHDNALAYAVKILAAELGGEVV